MQLFSGQQFGSPVAMNDSGSTDIKVPSNGVIQSFTMEAFSNGTLLDRRLLLVSIVINSVVVIDEWTPAQMVCDPLVSLEDRFIGLEVKSQDTVTFKVKNLSLYSATIHVGVRYKP